MKNVRASTMLLLQMDKLFRRAQDACDSEESASGFEPAFVELLQFLRSNPKLSDEYGQRFILGLRSGSLCWELVSFCMHELRTLRVKQEVIRIVKTADDPRQRDPLLHVLEAFEDDWEDAEMYDFYQ